MCKQLHSFGQGLSYAVRATVFSKGADYSEWLWLSHPVLVLCLALALELLLSVPSLWSFAQVHD